jgi:hypothetical protein
MDSQDKRVRTTPKDFFLYVAAMAALYASVFSLLALLFQYISVLFPDPLESFRDPYSSAIRFAIAALIVIFPLYILLMRVLNQDIRRHPEKKGLGIRRWVIYLTLFIAGVTVVGDLIVLINTFLGGELTTRFLLKVAAILVVIGGAFAYYFYDLRGTWERNAMSSVIVGWLTGAVVVATVVSGFFIMGTPQDLRMLRFDYQKIQDMQVIQSQVVSYWQSKDKLPASFADLDDPLYGFSVPLDPQSKESYRYTVIGPLEFELCAIFNTTSEDAPGLSSPAYNPYFDKEDWQYEEGESCFRRTIDPDLFSELIPAKPIR